MRKINKKILYGLLFSGLFLFINTAMAQNLTIRGTVVSKTDGMPVIGASVAEKDAANRIVTGTITDINGNFALKVKSTDNKLEVSFIGLKTFQTLIGQTTNFNIALEDGSTVLQDVVIEGKSQMNTGDLSLDKSRVTYASQTVSSKELSEVQATSIDDALQGRLSGVDIVANSGDPGAGMSIRIRGTSTLNASSDPLIVINGIPYETSVDKGFDFATADERGYAALIGVAPEDIKEITVLKDAASAAQYGSKAANGVLLITTKRGSKGKATFNYSYKGSMGYQPDGLPMLNGDQYSMLIREEYLNQSGAAIPYQEFAYDPTWTNFYYYSQNTNWLKEITQTGITNEHNFSVSGGGERAAYRISSGYLNETGTTIGTGQKRFTSRIALDYNVSDNLRVSAEMAFTHASVDRNYENLRDMAIRKMPNLSEYEMTTDGTSTGEYYNPVTTMQGAGNDWYNPVAMAKLGKNTLTNNRITPVFKLYYRPVNSLKYDFYVSFDASNDKVNSFMPQAAIGSDWTSTSANRSGMSDDEFYNIQTRNQLTFTPNLGDKHSVVAVASFNTFEKTSMGFDALTSNTPSYDLELPIVNSRIEGGDGKLASDISKQRNYYSNFRVNYQFLDRYVIDLSGRIEGNSKFGSRYRYGFFPAASARWLLGKEPFMKSFKFLDDLSLRATYGENGNAPSINYGAYNVYSTYSYKYIDVVPVWPSNTELVNFRWEKAIQMDFGFNLILFNDRINLDVDFYKKITKDQIQNNASIPTTSGYSVLANINAGDNENKGWEVNLMTRLVKTKNFSIDFTMDFSRNQNIITKISPLVNNEEGNPLTNGSYLKRLQVNNPIGSFYGYHYLGVYVNDQDAIARNTNGDPIVDVDGSVKYMLFNGGGHPFKGGDAKYEDMNHDGNINRLDVVYLGNANPLFVGGFGPTIRYKGLSLNMFFNYRYKNKIVNLARMNSEKMTNYDNQSTVVLHRWKNPGDITDIPRAYLNTPYNYLASDRFVEDGSFLRLKTLTIKYDLSKSLIQKMHLNTLSFYLTGSNLFTFTNYSGVDPEIPMGNDWKSFGYDNSMTPRAKIYTLGINVGF